MKGSVGYLGGDKGRLAANRPIPYYQTMEIEKSKYLYENAGERHVIISAM